MTSYFYSHAPGETSDYENPAYIRDHPSSHETSFNVSNPGSPTVIGINPEVVLRRQLADPLNRANR